jgi:LysM repeat protein/ribosomal protein S21
MINGKIFISYRRIDTEGYAGRIYDRLISDFNIFMDVDDIEPGDDFIDVLENALGSCDILLALIGDRWLEIKDQDGRRAIDDPKDFVRREIAFALERDIRVIPVLLAGTSMPTSSDLPGELSSFARCNAIEIRHSNFDADLNKFKRSLTKKLLISQNHLHQTKKKYPFERQATKSSLASSEMKRFSIRELIKSPITILFLFVSFSIIIVIAVIIFLGQVVYGNKHELITRSPTLTVSTTNTDFVVTSTVVFPVLTNSPIALSSTLTPHPELTLEIPSSYTLKPGEFLYCIARRFDIAPSALLSANGFNRSSVIYPGTTLDIPKDASAFDEGSRAVRYHPTTYTVRGGDTINSIACLFGDVWPETIIAENDLAGSYELYEGQEIQIP